jgi:hypothetical protein
VLNPLSVSSGNYNVIDLNATSHPPTERWYPIYCIRFGLINEINCPYLWKSLYCYFPYQRDNMLYNTQTLQRRIINNLIFTYVIKRRRWGMRISIVPRNSSVNLAHRNNSHGYPTYSQEYRTNFVISLIVLH